MKAKFFVVVLVGGIVSIFYLLLRTPNDGNHSDSTPTKRGQKLPVGTNITTPSAVTEIDSILQIPQETSNLDTKWLSEHDAGMTIHQSSLDGDFNRGSIQLGTMKGDLGETPPRYHHQLKAGKFTILLGEADDRHSFRHYATIVREENKLLRHDRLLSVSWTKWAPKIGAGGFVFRREESDIAQIGIIIPEIVPAPNSDPESLNDLVEVRLENPVRYIEPSTFDTLIAEPLDASRIGIMCTSSEGLPKSARVLWLKIGPSGNFEVMQK